MQCRLPTASPIPRLFVSRAPRLRARSRGLRVETAVGLAAACILLNLHCINASITETFVDSGDRIACDSALPRRSVQHDPAAFDLSAHGARAGFSGAEMGIRATLPQRLWPKANRIESTTIWLPTPHNLFPLIPLACSSQTSPLERAVRQSICLATRRIPQLEPISTGARRVLDCVYQLPQVDI